MTGKTTTIRSLVLALAHCYRPDQVAMILVDPSDPARRFFNYGSGDGNSIENLPHVLATVTNATELDEVVKRLYAEYDESIRQILKRKSKGFVPQDNKTRSIFVIIDHYDDADLLNSSGLGTLGLSKVGKGKNLHFIIGGSLDIMRDSSDKLRRRAESARYSLVLQDYEAVRYMGVRGDFAVKKELPPGRGFLVKAVQASLTQICLPFVDSKDGMSPDEQLADMIGAIRKKYRKSAQWSYQAKDLAPLEEAISAGGEGSGAAPAAVTGGQSSTLADLEKLMAMQANQASKKEEIPEAQSFASVEVPDDKGAKKTKRKAKPKAKADKGSSKKKAG
jgi:hypothetical protein